MQNSIGCGPPSSFNIYRPIRRTGAPGLVMDSTPEDASYAVLRAEFEKTSSHDLSWARQFLTITTIKK